VDTLVVAVGHNEYRDTPLESLRSLVKGNQPILVDVKSLYDRNKAAALGFNVFRL
jgi:UDP-N-acetyl-D-galactosamine dehydrogenase